jgi:hypothetical protein
MEELQKKIDSVTWKKAKPSPDYGPHEYIIRMKCSDVWNEIAKAIDEDGYKGEYNGKPQRYLDIGDYKY